MRRTAAAIVLAAALVAAFAIAHAPGRADAQGPPPGGPPPGAPAGMPVDSFVAERDSMIQVVLGRLGDRKGMAAESVFKKIEIMKGLPAEQLLARMNAFSRALGVSCRHCHVPGHWADEDKKNKQLARDMMRMSGAINSEYLAKMDFGGERASVNCMTCHRGEAEPMQSMRRAMRRHGGPGGPGGPPPGERR